ncbi:hypothetical protein ACJQWK_06177 [Exserohilum turcicum]|uniref:Cytidine deaminase n=1 Tax=Exserohilum turcicum (strain 28A) TaxID=671987 RepID=R0KL98_EXST2|nr:uncharacterized protein SETTUDRAFT_168004 [Exserohilum turcica Et28A]EOA88742.1 hypothetical protein SETTUDRAFT_168004 [Exserohilum turcica Et28A]
MSATTIPTFTPGESVKEENGLIHGVSVAELQVLGEQCFEARERAYCPYSLFRVGASLLLTTSTPSAPSATHTITGANIENASYPVGTCAERVAMGTAVMAGHRLGAFKAVGVTTDIVDYCSPCGMCRQFLREFLALETPIFMFNKEGKWIVRTMGELLPLSFGPDVLPPREELRKGQDADKAKTA